MSDLFDMYARQAADEKRGDRTFTLQTPPWQIGARVYRNSAQSIANNTSTAVTFSTARFDTDTMWAAGNPTRLTINTAGYYLVTGHISFDTNDAGRRSLGIRLGGATFIAIHSQMAITDGAVTSMSISTVYAFSATNYIELIVYQLSGGAININSSGNYSPEFAAYRLV